MNYSPTEINEMVVEGSRNQPIRLTPEELQVLKECSQEGVVQRAIPAGISFGIMGYILGRSGPLSHAKLGPTPAMMGLSVLGFMLGRLSYSKVCIERVLELPNGNLRKLLPNYSRKSGLSVEDSQDQLYSPIDMSPQSEDDPWQKQSTTSDIEMPTVSNFDTVPSDYYAEIKTDEAQVAPSKSYTSHDELRRQNRQNYTNKMYGEGKPMNQRYAEYPEDGGVTIKRREVRQPTQPEVGGGHKTKYGDVWDD